MLLAVAAQGMGPQRASANQKLHYLYSCRVVFWRFPMDDLVMPIKISPCNSLWNLKINTRSLAWVLIIHWHCLLPNDTVWTAAPAPSTPQPGIEKGENKFCRILCEKSMCDSQERQPVASSRKSGQSSFSQEVNDNHTLYLHGTLNWRDTWSLFIFFSGFSL